VAWVRERRTAEGEPDAAKPAWAVCHSPVEGRVGTTACTPL